MGSLAEEWFNDGVSIGEARGAYASMRTAGQLPLIGALPISQIADVIGPRGQEVRMIAENKIDECAH